jgi:carbamoyl-phosphate synthase large subunit
MDRVLVSGASGVVGYGIARSILENNYILATTIYPDTPAECFSNECIKVPPTTDPGYLSQICKVIEENKIDIAFPGIELDVQEWSKDRDVIEATGAKVVLNNPQLIEACVDKWNMYNILKKYDIPERIESSVEKDFNRFSLPFIVKMKRGYGSKGLIKICTREQFEEVKDRIGDSLFIQEYVGTDEEEYTVGVFFDKKSEVRAHIAMRRKLSAGGFTGYAEVVDSEQFLPSIRRLAEVFSPVGPTNFQFRKHNGEIKLLEINPRISASTYIRTRFGYNESQMAIDYFLHEKKIDQPTIKKGKAIRYVEEYMIYDSNNI